MRLLTLHFKNLNSLAGEWRIDFTVPELSEQLFLIHGPTGAGKTTILDAVVLALYGRTPRQDSISAQNCEVMTRGAADSFAEVAFEIAGRSYRARWEQQRAHRKAANSLTAAKRFLLNGDGTILAEKIKDTGRMIVEILGMEFEEFTRTVMLTQGNFDAFLKASEKSRAQILEKITGTGIYHEIGEQVMERRSAECAKRDELAAHLSGITRMPEEERREKEAEYESLMTETTRLRAELKSCQELLAAEMKHASLSEHLRNAVAEKERVDSEYCRFLPELNRQTVAENARRTDVLFRNAEAARNRNQLAERALQKRERMRIEKEQEWKKASSLLEEAERRHRNRSSEWEELQQKLIRARELDGAIREKQGRMDLLEAQKKKIRQSLDASRNILAEQKKIRETSQRVCESAQSYRNEHAGDAGLSGFLASCAELKGRLAAAERALHLSQAEKSRWADAPTEKTLSALEQKIAEQEELYEHSLTARNLTGHRNKLKNGEACPLCGALEHPYCAGLPVPPAEDVKSFLKRLRSEIHALNAWTAAETACHAARKECESAEQHLKELFQQFSFPFPGADALDRIMRELEERREHYLNSGRDLEHHEYLAHLAVRRILELENQIQVDSVEFEKLQMVHQGLTASFSELTEERKGFFEGRAADEEEKKGKEHLAKAAAELELRRKNENSAVALIQGLNRELERERAELADSEKEKAIAETALNEGVASFGFGSAEECRAARLDDEEFLRGMERRGTLSEQRRFCENAVRTFAADLAEHCRTHPAIPAAAELNRMRDSAQIQMEEKMRLSGELAALLSEDEKNRKEQARQYAQWQEQQIIAERWERLHQLLGRGENFRRYAQSISFRALLERANPWMRELLPRYVLTTGNDAGSLEPFVLDMEKSASLRSVTNLSGGETFLVSLALALSLAHMNEGALRIQSLFLDEGFGTLDDKSLSMAIDALQRLGSEHGKTIGVISHVPALKEVISGQLVITPGGGGHSRISGPGVQNPH